VTAHCKDAVGTGHIRMIQPKGLSVISDIDDTIKITEVPAGAAIVLRNTFLNACKEVPGMLERYRGFGVDTTFHYISGSPWQMFDLLHRFLIAEKKFPDGTFHMKDLRACLSGPVWLIPI